jgi:hypothetical protein
VHDSFACELGPAKNAMDGAFGDIYFSFLKMSDDVYEPFEGVVRDKIRNGILY